MEKVLRCFLSGCESELPESLFDKVELYDLQLSLGKPISPYIELDNDEYLWLKANKPNAIA